MKDITANATVQKNKKYDVAPVNLLIIEFGGVVGTKYYSDRPITINDADGNLAETYEAYVASWGSIDGIRDDISSSNDLRITLVNSDVSPISELFSIEPPEGKVARLYQWFEDTGMTDDDKILLFNGRISSPVSYNLDRVEFDIIDRTLDMEIDLGTVANKTDYPQLLNEHSGRLIPMVFGEVAYVPAICTTTAGKSALAETISDAVTTITVDDASVFPETTFVLIVEDEKIQVTGGIFGNQLLGCVRAYDSTTAVLHLKGAEVYENLSEFFYTVHDGTPQSISNVRLNGQLIDPSEYSIDAVVYPGQIRFTHYPSITEEKETVWTEYQPDLVPDSTGYPVAENIDNLIDDDPSTYAILRSGFYAEVQRSVEDIVLDGNSTFKNCFLVVKYKSNQEWDDDVKIYGYFDDNKLDGQLDKPTFDPVEPSGIAGIQNYDPPDTQRILPKPITFATNNDATPAQSSDPKIETAVELTSAEDVTFEPIDSYTTSQNYAEQPLETADWQVIANSSGGGYFDVYHILTSQILDSESKWYVGHWTYIDVVSFGYDWNKPSGDDWYLADAQLSWSNTLTPVNVRVEERGVKIGSSYWRKGKSRVFANSMVITESRLRIYPEIVTSIGGAGNISTPIVNLHGTISQVAITLTFEREVAIPPIPPPVYVPPDPPPPDPEPPETIPTIMSHEMEKTFIIGTNVGVTSETHLNDKNFGVRFEESSADKPDLQVYITDMYLQVETGKYNFEYTDRLTADVGGYFVDGTNITEDYGELNELITRPDQIIKFILTHSTFGSLFSLVDINLTKYALATTFYDNYGYRSDFAIVETITLKNILEKIAFQVRTDQYWEDGLHVLKVLTPDQTAVKSVGTSEIVDIAIERSDIGSVINSMELRYKYDYSFFEYYTPNRFLGIVKEENLDSQADYGIRKDIDKIFYFDTLRDPTTVTHVTLYYMGYFSVIKTFMKLSCFLDQIELQKHDIVNVTWPLDGLAASPCRVLDSRIVPGSKNGIDKIEVTLLREDYTYTQVLLAEGLTVSDVLIAILGKGITADESPTVSDALVKSVGKFVYENVGVSDVLTFAHNVGLFIQDSPSWGRGAWGSAQVWGTNNSILISDELVIEWTRGVAANYIVKELIDHIVVTTAVVLLLGTQHGTDNDSVINRVGVSDELVIVKY